MTLRRILIITIILLVLVGLLFGASWYVSRRTASKNGTTPLTFRQFLGIGTPAAPGLPAQGEFVSQFTTDANADKNNNGVLDGEEDLNFNGSLDKNDIVISAAGQKTEVFTAQIKSAANINAIAFSRFGDTNQNTINDWNEDIDGNGEIDGVEDKDRNGTIDGYDGGLVIGGNPSGGINLNPDGFPNDGGGFTNGTIMPSDTFGSAGGNPGSGVAGTPVNPTTVGGAAPSTPTDPPPVQSTAIESFCSDADTNIEFTAAEIARLNILQNRFYTIAQSLRSDSDVQTELSNYDAFKVKASQTLELYNYCQSKLPLITNPALQKRVATPFWRDSAKDSQTFLSPEGPLQGEMSINHSEKSMPTLLRILQNVLHINLW